MISAFLISFLQFNRGGRDFSLTRYQSMNHYRSYNNNYKGGLETLWKPIMADHDPRLGGPRGTRAQ
jgi:hypothetical protein